MFIDKKNIMRNSFKVLSSMLWCPLRFANKNDVRFVFASRYSLLFYFICVCLHIVVSCVVFLFLFFFVLCTLCRQFLTIVHFCLPLRYSLTCIWLVCCVPCITSFLRFTLLIAPSVFSNVYLTCVLCTLYYQFLTIVHCWLPLRYSLTCIWLVCCVPCITSFLWLSIVDCPFGIF